MKDVSQVMVRSMTPKMWVQKCPIPALCIMITVLIAKKLIGSKMWVTWTRRALCTTFNDPWRGQGKGSTMQTSVQKVSFDY